MKSGKEFGIWGFWLSIIGFLLIFSLRFFGIIASYAAIAALIAEIVSIILCIIQLTKHKTWWAIIGLIISILFAAFFAIIILALRSFT